MPAVLYFGDVDQSPSTTRKRRRAYTLDHVPLVTQDFHGVDFGGFDNAV